MSNRFFSTVRCPSLVRHNGWMPSAGGARANYTTAADAARAPIWSKVLRNLLPSAVALGACAVFGAARAEPVSFTVQHVVSGPAKLYVALFRPSSKDWDKRFKRSENADLSCSVEVSGKQTTEVVTCDLAPSEYIGVAFVDTDGNGLLTHGVLGPTEQFGLTGIEEGIKFPPESKRTVIDTRRNNNFTIVLN
jgi:uncharacterized protein (DUF2141 family)